MSLENVKNYFKKFGIEERIIELNESSATVELAAAALKTDENRIAKTMSFLVGEKAVLVVTAGDMKIDNAKFKSFFHEKAKMLSVEQLKELVNHEPGGVCPFGVPEDVNTYLDISLKRFETVFPAAGASNSCIELTLPELEKYSINKKWVDICKPKK